MKLPHALLAVLAVTSHGLVASSRDAAHIMRQLSHRYTRDVVDALPGTSCRREDIVIRREWDSLSPEERIDYTRAVKCLQAKPSRRGNATLARSRYEDFLLTHIDKTFTIHFSGLLLPWHRYYLWLYEKALRDECGYQGYQPYWDWSKWAADPSCSTIFDGSDVSMSGNGEAIPHEDVKVVIPGGPPPVVFVPRPAGEGGGCVVDGPFANTQVHIGVNSAGASGPVQVYSKPRCLTRDFLPFILQRRNSYANVTDLILNSPDIDVFYPSVDSKKGVHGGGHAFIGGENLNQFVSPNDPIFYLHHAMLDRVWAIWQSRDPDTRQYALNGTLTWENYPPSPDATVRDIMEVGILGADAEIGEVMSTTEGPLCYVYE
ncbi:putative domain, di-copper centre [Ophiocordyceps camponoti-floridani]|uniref:Putative domain, di-copper centre n=1 Tax=Ophiocordyceps camponoti-floridani TaxID=2030778 RepID=A0A8H4VEL5_9HYPO|nr:putative domain, di-copper centre [Ophiocordyceps camponoti-floridani]